MNQAAHRTTPRLAAPFAACCLALALQAAAPAAQAGEIYVPIGLPGVGLGYAQPVSPSWAWRADYVTLGSRTRDRTEQGIAYEGRLKTGRGGLFADWFPFDGSFRFSLGVTANRYQLDLDASGAGRTINVGGTNYTLVAGDGFNALVKFPSTTPYVGFGWGHGVGNGMRFAVDVGASVGKATIAASGRGALASASAQADIDRELAELRDGVGKVRALPQLSLSLGYSF